MAAEVALTAGDFAAARALRRHAGPAALPQRGGPPRHEPAACKVDALAGDLDRVLADAELFRRGLGAGRSARGRQPGRRRVRGGDGARAAGRRRRPRPSGCTSRSTWASTGPASRAAARATPPPSTPSCRCTGATPGAAFDRLGGRPRRLRLVAHGRVAALVRRPAHGGGRAGRARERVRTDPAGSPHRRGEPDGRDPGRPGGGAARRRPRPAGEAGRRTWPTPGAATSGPAR